ncbi:MAG TPA: ABATE domain-containing protein [Kofleriaceae bacterium]|nr:ABATE domain-containing protein [Kofleriaceae bacterium]
MKEDAQMKAKVTAKTGATPRAGAQAQARAREVAGDRRGRFLFLARSACLDFVNTELMAGGRRVDLLAGFADLVDWLRAADLIDEREARAARRRWGASGAGRSALRRARRLRGELRAVAERVAAGRPVGARALRAINAVLERPVRASELCRAGAGFARVDRWSFAAAEDLLAPVAESARDLLAGGDLALVRRCRNPDCILFFHDTTRNRGRAWCSMSSCGNRDKVATHYRRRRAAARVRRRAG